MLATVRILGQHQYSCRRGQDETDTDERFLDGGPALVCPVQYVCRDQRSRYCGDLHHESFRFPAHRIRRDHAESRNLCDGEIDKNDSTPQNLRSERHVRTQNQQARQERGQDDAEFKRVQRLCSSSMRMVVS